MNYLELYQARLKKNGTNLGDELRKSTHYAKNQKFSGAMTYRKAKVYINKGTARVIEYELDIRVIEVDRQSMLRNILVKPNVDINTGCILEFDDDLWLCYQIYGSTVDDLKLRVYKINDTLIWKDRNGAINKLPCIASVNFLGSGTQSNRGGYLESPYNVNTPDGKILLFVEKMPETMAIELKQRFIIGSKVYKVVYKDDVSLVERDYDTDIKDNGHGLLKFNLEIDLEFNQKDDFENRIAYNDVFEVNENDENEGEEDWEW